MDAYAPRTLFDLAYSHPRKVLLFPLLMFLLPILVLGHSYATTGSVVEKGIDFTGGTEVHVPVSGDVSPAQMEEVFGGESSARRMSGGGTDWIIVEAKETYDQEEVESILQNGGIPYDSSQISIRSLGSSVGGAFFQEAQLWAGIALIIMSAVIFVAFRTVVPSLAVIFAALTDILFALAGMSLLGIDLTLGSLAALLMLLGYSVDTDILLSTRVLKQKKDDLSDRIWSSVLTGSTMTLAAIAAFTVLLLVSPSGTLDQIAAVIVIGLVADLPVTWLGNAFILRWYVERG